MLWSHAVLSPLSLRKQQFIYQSAWKLQYCWERNEVVQLLGGGGQRERERERERGGWSSTSQSVELIHAGSLAAVVLFCAAGLILKTSYSEAPDSTCHVFPLSLRLPVWNTKAWSFKSNRKEIGNFLHLTFTQFTYAPSAIKWLVAYVFFPLHVGLSCHINY